MLIEILTESKKYSDRGFNGKISPYSLLIMTRMLYKYRNNNAQWLRVATVLELIYNYLGDYVSREQYFKNNDEISVRSLMELEEFYNTDHIFMSKSQIKKANDDIYNGNFLGNFTNIHIIFHIKKQIVLYQVSLSDASLLQVNLLKSGFFQPSGFKTLPSSLLITLPVMSSILARLLLAPSSHAPSTS